MCGKYRFRNLTRSRAMPDGLWAARHCIFTGGVVERETAFAAPRFLRKRGAAVSVLALSVSSLRSLPPLPKGEARALPETFSLHLKLQQQAFDLGSPFGRAGAGAPERVRSPGGAVAQRLRGFESAEPKKTVKRSSRRTGVNLQFFSVQSTSSGLKGASSPFFVAPARRNRWWFSGSLLPPKENIPPAASRMVTASSARPDSGYSRAGSAPKTSRPPDSAWPAARRAAA